MFKSICPNLAIVLVSLLTIAAQLPANGKGLSTKDEDGDGICDEHEQILGTDPARADRLITAIEETEESPSRRKQENYDPTKDVRAVEFCHIGEDRFLWRVTLVEPPRLEDTVLHLYVDADADSGTGRKGPEGSASTGTEYMLSVVAGQGRATHYAADGQYLAGPLVTFVVDGSSILLTSDVDLTRDGPNARYALYILCHTTTNGGQSARMSDSSSKQRVAHVPLVNRKKILRPRDHRQNYLVEATFGYSLIRKTLDDPNVQLVAQDQWDLNGFEVDHFNTRRWPQVRRTEENARMAVPPPRSGRFHVGFTMYDDSNDERIGLYIDGKLHGIAVANQNNSQTWMYWVKAAHLFTGSEKVELRAFGASGKHGISNVLFLPTPPEVRRPAYEVKYVTSTTKAGQPGHATVSWVTTWPCATRFQFGKDTNYGESKFVGGNCLVHRVVLEGLDPDTEYHGQAIGTRPDGSEFASDDFQFRAAEPVPPPTRAKTTCVPLKVENPHSFPAANWPVTTGIPFPKGQLASPDHVRLMEGEREVLAQVRLAARWPDGSVKWLLVTFVANVPGGQQRIYQLEFGAEVRRNVAAAWTIPAAGDGLALDTGSLRCRLDSRGSLRSLERDGRAYLDKEGACVTSAVDAQGVRFSASAEPAPIQVEESGPVRAIIKVTSHLQDTSGKSRIRIEKRVFAYRNAAFLRIHHTFVVESSERFLTLDSLDFHVPLARRSGYWRAETTTGESLALNGAEFSVHQQFDNEIVVCSEGRQATQETRVVGAIRDDGVGGCAVAVRDFWQNYPKAFSLDDTGLHVGLCPHFEKGVYDSFPFEKEGHHLYYYLLDGHYKLKRGVSKTHELLLSLADDPDRTSQCAWFQRPLLAIAPAKWYCASKAFYDVAPRNEEWFPAYERAIDKNLVAYVKQRERQHDFGMLNYGDWYGERGTNWGNIEYDTQHAFFLEFIRSGNPAAFFLGEATERHNRDVDTVQWSENTEGLGAVYVHQMCHVGEYYDKPVPGSLGFPRGGYTVSHAWSEGHFDHYFLTGDPRSFETGRAVTDFFIRKQLGRPYDFSVCRTPGWHLIMLAAAYAATNDPYYLNAARVVMDRVLETQDRTPRSLPPYQSVGREPFQIGGWPRMMVPGHCHCEPRHRGNAGFMVAILLSGMKYYHDVTQDPRVKEAIVQGAYYLLDETYSDQTHGFRYTSCPETDYRIGTTPLMVEGIARAYLWTKDDRFRRVLTEALPRGAGGSAYGKGFSMYYRMAPRVLADLRKAGIRLETP